ncbi:hypothetical protein WR25_13341 [Diploscapter pachys]|uniref:Uncharacterized protein n=1 Tax=Diploscapter pachys TaxID=2018661 RepID=A0A2A2JHX9_9BILA|nr:hypothetical protein WR25_13341 [Diploscapter pachys]
MAEQQRQQVVVLVGENHEEISQKLASEAGNGSTKDNINISNQYYSAFVKFDRYRNVDAFLKNAAKYKNAYIGSLMITHSKDAEIKKLFASSLNSDIQLVIFKTSEGCSDETAKYFQEKFIERIILNPNQEDLEDYISNQEKYGIERIFEAIQTAEWPNRQMHSKNGPGKVGDSAIDRLIELIKDLPDSEDEDAEPNKEDEEEIWSTFSPFINKAIFSASQSSSSKKEEIIWGSAKSKDSPQRAVVVHLPSNDDEESEDTATVSVNVDVAFVKKPSATVETTAVSEQTSSTKNKNKNKKKKKGQKNQAEQNGETAETAEESLSPADEKLRDTLGDIFGTEEEGGFSLGNLKEVKEKISQLSFNNKNRIDIAEAFVKKVSDQIVYNENDEEGEEAE